MNKPYQEISLLEFQKKYQREEDCEMLHKIRHAMKNCDTAYQLAGIVEIDDSFFGSSITGRSKRGRGTSKTAVIVEASPHGDAIGFAKNDCGRQRRQYDHWTPHKNGYERRPIGQDGWFACLYDR